MLLIIITLIFLLTAWIYYKSNKAHSIWKNKGVSQAEPPFFFGQTKGMVFKQESSADFVSNVYNKYPNKRYVGMYQFYRPILMIRDPDLLKQITVKDFDYFTDHLSFIPENYDPLFNRNLFSLKGDKWREMRSTLSPAFTSSKMKAMFMLMNECSQQFTNYFLNKDGPIIIELKDASTRFANDVIATCAFGVKCDSLKERENEFYQMGKKATDFSSILTVLKFSMLLVLPKISKLLGLTFFPENVGNFFKNLITKAVQMREENNIIRPDMIHLLMEARKGMLKHEENQDLSKETGFATIEESELGKVFNKEKLITDKDITAQALVFFFAGFDTVSTLITFMGYELAVNPDIQNRLRDEIDEVLQKYKGKITYDAISKMKYLDMVVSESLRKWPPIAGMDRACVKPYTIKSTTPDESDVQIVTGEGLFIPIWGFHYDQQYFPNPKKFDPDRFSDENKDTIKPYTYIPFGVGPRNCIGSRFALFEVKVLYVNLLSKLELFVVEKTNIPMKLEKGMNNITSENGCWEGLKRRKQYF